MVATVVNEASVIKKENDSIKTTLTKANISANAIQSTLVQYPQQNTASSDLNSFQQAPREVPYADSESFQSPQYSNWPSNSSSSNVSIIFDEFIDASCLQVNPYVPLDTATESNSPETLNLATNAFSNIFQTATKRNEGLQKQLPQLPGQAVATSNSPLQPDISSIAINFVLA